MTQMGVTELSKTFFVIWTPHGILIDQIEYDSELWNGMKDCILEYYHDFYLKSIYNN